MNAPFFSASLPSVAATTAPSGGLPEAALWLLALGPAVVGATLCGVMPGRRVAQVASLLTALVAAALAVLVSVERPSVSAPFLQVSRFALGVDTLSAVVLVTVAVVTVLVLIFATGDVTDSTARFHGLMLLFLSAVVITAAAENLLTLLIAWEVMGATSYALIGFRWRDPSTGEAGMVAFLTTRAADIGLYVAAGAALAGGAGLGLGQLTQASDGWRNVIAAGIVAAALGKAAQLPFSFWLARAMAGPSAVSALLHSAAMVAMGGYLLLRVSDLLQITGWAATTVAWAGALTAVLMGVVALLQSDLKQLLAASTAAQLGFVVLAAGVGAIGGGTSHFVAHAATKALLFLLAGAWLTALGTKQLDRLVGVGRRWPGLGAVAVVGLLSLAGIAPLSLWVTKDTVLAGALHESGALYAVGLLAAALSAGYAAKVLLVILAPTPANTVSTISVTAPGTDQVIASAKTGTGADSDAQPPEQSLAQLSAQPAVSGVGAMAPDVVSPASGRIAAATWTAVPPLALGAAVLGLVVLLPPGQWLREQLDGPGVPGPTVAELAVSGAVALAVLGAMVFAGWRRRRFSSRAVHPGVAPRAHLQKRQPGFEAGPQSGSQVRPEAGPLDGASAARPSSWVGEWFRLEHWARRALVAPTLRLANLLAAFDTRGLDRGIDASAQATLRLADRMSALDVRRVDGLVESFGRAMRRLGELARRPQTGQLHEYYAQAAALLLVGLILLVVIG